jgi:hypothetical protein
MSPALNGQKSPCYTVLFLHFFRKAFPRPTAKAPRGEGERGVFAFHFPASSCGPPARCRFLRGGLSEKQSSLELGRGKEKVRFLRSGSLTPGNQRTKTSQPICARAGVPLRKVRPRIVEARHRQFPHLKSKFSLLLRSVSVAAGSARKMSGQIFISYRRDDSAPWARLVDTSLLQQWISALGFRA